MAMRLIEWLRDGLSRLAGRRPDPATKSDPQPAGWIEREPGVVEFRLWAPGKRSVAVAGSWNGWSPAANPLRARGDGGWTTQVRLGTGTHEYMYVIDGATWLGDPYAREVRWGKDGPHAVLRVGARPFRWTDHGFGSPDLREQVLYEVNLAEFSPEGTFAGATARLEHVKSLGVRGVELMPLWEFPGDVSLGYNPAFFFAPEARYGAPDELKRFVNEAHRLSLAVVLDVVFNHASREHPFDRLYSYGESPWFGGDNPWGMPDFDHGKAPTRDFVEAVQAFWLEEYHLDGFRYDATRFIEGGQGQGFGHLAWHAASRKPAAYRVAEHIPEDPGILGWTALDACWHEAFRGTVMANLREDAGAGWGDLDALMAVLDPRKRGYRGPRQVVNYLENHDQDRLVAEVARNPWLAGRHELVAAKARLGVVTLAVAAGIPMLYAGQEIGMEARTTTAGVRPIDWRRLHSREGRELVAFVQRVLWFRNTHPALRSDDIDFPGVFRGQKTLAVHRWNDRGDDVVAVLNFDGRPQSVRVRFPQPGPWHEFLGGGVVATGGQDADVNLPASGAAIFGKWKNW